METIYTGKYEMSYCLICEEVTSQEIIFSHSDGRTGHKSYLCTGCKRRMLHLE